MLYPLEELLVFGGLLSAVVGVYFILKLHYVFAFGLVKNTSISEEKKQKIEKIKSYIFAFLKVLLLIGLVAMVWFGTSTLIQGESLKAIVLHLWLDIPEGFWFSMLWTLIRIAILIVVMRFILKKVFTYLEIQEEKTIAKKVYNKENIKKVYMRIHNTIKFTVVLGVIYRIIHFFPFLEEVSIIFLMALLLFVVSALLITIKELIFMLNTRK